MNDCTSYEWSYWRANERAHDIPLTNGGWEQDNAPTHLNWRHLEANKPEVRDASCHTEPKP